MKLKILNQLLKICSSTSCDIEAKIYDGNEICDLKFENLDYRTNADGNIVSLVFNLSKDE